MASVVNVAITDTFILRDNANAAITGKTSADFATIEAYQISSPSTAAAVTLAEIGSGTYRISFTPTTVASWTAHVVYSAGGVFREYEPDLPYDVLPAAADPAAIADALAAVQTTVDGVAAMTDVATSTRASAAVWTTDRAERVDRIGTDSVTVRSATAATAMIELRQGADYTASADTALEWDVTTDTDLSPEGTIVTLTISSRSLQGDDAITAICTVTNPSAATKTLTADLTDAETSLLRTNEFTRYQIDAQIGADTVPLVEGKVKVLPSIA